MMDFEFLAIPFFPRISSAEISQRTAQEIANQLQQLINQNASEGWEFSHIDQINVVAAPGCLSSLFGAKAGVVTYNVAIFRRKRV